MEKDWANALKEVPPKKVSVKIFPSYQGDSIRPIKFRIEYQIEGEPKIRRTIRNQSGG
ncbi:DNA/RNA non-specific endonuclease [Priestia aryabhattai]|nr:DNA/RNA non-specific endonuclease [Priestia aryabhattai]